MDIWLSLVYDQLFMLVVTMILLLFWKVDCLRDFFWALIGRPHSDEPEHPTKCMCSPCQKAFIQIRRDVYEAEKQRRNRQLLEEETEKHLKAEYGFDLTTPQGHSAPLARKYDNQENASRCIYCGGNVNGPPLQRNCKHKHPPYFLKA